MMRATHLALLTTILSGACYALDKPRSQVEVLDLTEVNANVATLQQNLELFPHDSTAFDECPICDDDDDEEADRISQQILSKASGMIQQTSTFARLKRVTQTRLGRRRYNKSMAPDSIVPILIATGSHFAAFARRAQQDRIQTSSNNSSPLAVELKTVLQEVSTLSSNVAFELAGVMQVANRTTAGVVTISALSLFDFLDRVSLGTTSLVVDYLSVLNGGTAQGVKTKAAALRASLSANSTDRVFGEVLSFLNAIGDKSGLTTTLTKLTMGLTGLDDRLAKLASLADAFTSTAAKSFASATPIKSDPLDQAYVEIFSLIAGIILTAMNSMQNIMQDGLGDDMGGTVRSALGLVLRSAESILNQSAVTTNALLTVASPAVKSGSQKGGDSTGVAGDTVLFLFFSWVFCNIITPAPAEDDIVNDEQGLYCWLPALLLSPLFWVGFSIALLAQFVRRFVRGLLCVVTSCQNVKNTVTTCQAERLACQSDALSAALPSM